MLFRRQAEPPLGRERKGAGIARHLPHHEGQITAAQAFFQREQRILGRSGNDMDQPVAQRRWQARTIGPPGLAQAGTVLHPQPGPFIPSQGAMAFKRQGKGRARAILRTAE